jgi:hypothetical protein
MAMPFALIVICAGISVLIAVLNGVTDPSGLLEAASFGTIAGGLISLLGGLEFTFGTMLAGVIHRDRPFAEYLAIAAGYAAVWIPAFLFVRHTL